MLNERHHHLKSANNNSLQKQAFLPTSIHILLLIRPSKQLSKDGPMQNNFAPWKKLTSSVCHSSRGVETFVLLHGHARQMAHLTDGHTAHRRPLLHANSMDFEKLVKT
jgi:hypothetical protein